MAAKKNTARPSVALYIERECREVIAATKRANVTHLSEASGVSMTTLFRIRAGKHRPSPDTIDAIWAGLDRLGEG